MQKIEIETSTPAEIDRLSKLVGKIMNTVGPAEEADCLSSWALACCFILVVKTTQNLSLRDAMELCAATIKTHAQTQLS